MITALDKTPLDVWFVFDDEDDEDPSHEANTFLTDDYRFRVEWCHTGVGQITEVEFDTYAQATAWLEGAGYVDYSSGEGDPSWVNTVPRELWSVLRDRGEKDSAVAARWLKKHESDSEVWDIIGHALDSIEKLALFDIEMSSKKS